MAKPYMTWSPVQHEEGQHEEGQRKQFTIKLKTLYKKSINLI